MDLPQLILRIIHVLLGVYWAGTIFFMATFLQPAMQDAGPDAAKVGAALMRRRLVDVLPVAAVLTVLSGLWLFMRASAGAAPGFMGSGPGIAYSLGGAAAILGLVLGLTIVRPSMLKAAALGQIAAAAPAAEKEGHLAAALALRTRVAGATRWVAVLLAITVLMMAVGRYL